MVSLSVAIPLARFHLLPLYDVLNTVPGWSPFTQVRLSSAAYRKLKFYFSSIPPADVGSSILPATATETLFTDASSIAWGAHLEHSVSDVLISDRWAPAWADDHINVKELRAIHLSLSLLGNQLAGKHV